MTTVETEVVHQWSVVAPWWFWPQRTSTDPSDPGRPEDRRAVRVTRPAFQKYETPDLVNTFLAHPQRRVEWDPDTDEVWDVSARKSFGKLPVRTPTHVRKLYLDVHHRHYLVACSLRCDTAGFPYARTDDVCEAGYVARRRTLDLRGGPDGELARDLRRYAVARAKRVDLQRRLAVLQTKPGATSMRSAIAASRLDSLVARERDAQDDILEWTRTEGPLRTLEGWVPTGVDAGGNQSPLPGCGDAGDLTPLAGVGSWQPVEELPDRLDEAWYPLSALYADPGKPDSDATGESIYFGIVPTGSSDVDGLQQTRYDDKSEYEIRCFVRRHRAVCPRSGGHCTCPITWSEPSEAYRLASFFDLEGTANRPTTVQMPDLSQLQADAMRLTPGGSGGVRFKSPPGSELCFTSKDTTATKTPSPDGEQLCSFAIPLITIVAFFVLQLFLPIVVFVFQLWFLLTMKFCLPPEITLEAGLAAKIDAVGGGLDIDAGAAAALEADPGLAAALDDLLGGPSFSLPGGGSATMSQSLRSARAAGDIDVETFASLVSGVFAQGATAHAPLLFARRVERWEVVRP